MHLSRLRRRTSAVLALTFVAVSLAVAPPASAETKGWDAGNSTRPTMNDLIPEPADGEAYSERYGISAKLDGGGKIVVNFTISNIGWGNQKGAAEVKVKLPDHEDYQFNKKVDRDKWSYAKDRFKLDIADTVIEGNEDGTFALHHDGEVDLEMTLSSDVPMWRPGRGRVEVDDGYMAMDIFQLRGTAEGTVTIDGNKREFKSTRDVYADHVSTDIAPYNLANRFSRTRVYDDDHDLFFLWREIKLTGEHGGESVNWVMVGYKDQIVFSDANAEVKFGKVRKDKVGYSIPYAIQIEGESGEDNVKIVLRAQDMRRKNLLRNYGSVVKTFAKTVSEPYNYYFHCKYAVEMDIQGAKATVRGKGGYVVDYLNKP